MNINIIKFMFGLIERKKTTAGYINEKRFFKHNFHMYVVKYAPTWEFYAISQRSSKRYLLGTYNPEKKEFERVGNYYQLDYHIQGVYGAKRLFKWAIEGKKPNELDLR